MARVTVEDCLDHVTDMYELVHVATKRARQLYSGQGATLRSKNKQIVTALREIAEGHIATAMDTSDEEEHTV